MSDACSTCASAGSCTTESCSTEPKLTEAQKASQVKNLIAVMSGKGGVGKSSVTGMLATSLHNQGYKVGVLDADITGPSIPKIFGVTEKAMVNSIGVTPPKSKGGIKIMSLNLMLENEDDPVIWRGAIITQLVQQFWTDVVWGELDYLLIDMPPGTGDVPITVFQSLPISGIVVVSSPQQLAGMIVRKAINMAKKYDARIYGLIENMAYVECPDCHTRLEIFGKPQGELEAQKSEISFLGQLPLDPSLASLSDAGRIEEYQSEGFRAIAARLADEIAK
ncbi:Mrp/NBP35 family ATP-binding protein [Paradesulfitobacterium ferrireducens]|uniref:Mrp/NBP35 family ATP-binding protein n=1 Tax=Paradesulfitobacterium ferrireducens TaxID=2816476 RepID=UPI001A8D1F4A|nr:Mrp/NBP35 family ATP-binding protein [Paradesulfitobacterium ferrireducens]